MRNLLQGLAMAGVLAAIQTASAAVNSEQFVDPGYVVGDPLGSTPAQSTTYWNGQDNTAGVLDIEGTDPVGSGTGDRWVKMIANGPSPGPVLPQKVARYDSTSSWGGPNRSVASGTLYWSVDIHKGIADANTSLNSFIWSIAFTRSNGENFFTLDGGLGTVRGKPTGGANSASFNLADGWNRIAVVNNPGTGTIGSGTNEFIMYLNGVQVYAADIAGTVALTRQGSGIQVDNVFLQRSSRGGTGDYFVGAMWFDNFLTANEPLLDMNAPTNLPEPPQSIPEPTTLALLSIGGLCLLRRRLAV